MKKLKEDANALITSTITSPIEIGQMNISKSSPDQKDSPKPEYPTTVVTSNMRAARLEGGHWLKTDSLLVQYIGTVRCGFNFATKDKHSKNERTCYLEIKWHFHNDAYLQNLPTSSNRYLNKA